VEEKRLAIFKICSVDLLPLGSLKAFQINGKEIVLINSRGSFFCLQGRCTHAGAPLVEGTVENDVLTCPWHGSKFKITNGELVKGPAKKGLQAYVLNVNDGFIYGEIE
jgi:3-phenylpropionate/trans-cinnamate dioxygenase ferredoxin component